MLSILNVFSSHARQILVKTIDIKTHGIIHLLLKVLLSYLTKIHFIIIFVNLQK